MLNIYQVTGSVQDIHALIVTIPDDAVEVKLRSERGLGELTREMERSQGLRSDLTSGQDGAKSYRQQLRETKIEPKQAYRWQQAEEASFVLEIVLGDHL